MTIRHGDFSFDLGEQPYTFKNITHYPSTDMPSQTLNVASMSQLLKEELSVEYLKALDFPCKEAARAISNWLASEKGKFDTECFNAKTRGDPPPVWQLWA